MEEKFNKLFLEELLLSLIYASL